MTRLERIEKEIAQLSASEFDDFRAWFEAFDAARWDGRLESDVASAALDRLADAALSEHRAGRSKPL